TKPNATPQPAPMAKPVSMRARLSSSDSQIVLPSGSANGTASPRLGGTSSRGSISLLWLSPIQSNSKTPGTTRPRHTAADDDSVLVTARRPALQAALDPA